MKNTYVGIIVGLAIAVLAVVAFQSNQVRTVTITRIVEVQPAPKPIVKGDQGLRRALATQKSLLAKPSASPYLAW